MTSWIVLTAAYRRCCYLNTQFMDACGRADVDNFDDNFVRQAKFDFFSLLAPFFIHIALLFTYIFLCDTHVD